MNKKKMLIGITAVALLALMIANVYASLRPPVPAPTFCGCLCRGLTPGFWKHNIQVRLSNDPYNLDLTNGAYSAYPNGTKLDDDRMDWLLAQIQAEPGMAGFTFVEALEYLQLPGWSTDRTNTANWFNWASGLGPF